jgi:microsomal dipeptidase-like Zn-dependent dipeptidase
MPIFDFHCHPALKPLMSPAGQEPTPWEYIKATLAFATPFSRTIGINKLFNGALNSQSNLSQLFFGKVNLAGIVLYAPESQMGVGVLRKGIAASGKINVLDPGKLKLISRGDRYYDWTKQTVDLLTNNLNPKPSDDLPAGVNFKFIKSINEYKRNDLNTIHGIAIVEGMHCFTNDAFSPNAAAEVEANFNDFVQRYASKNVRLFACNITHLQHLPFGTHASGLQFIDDNLFYPEGSGLSQLGKNIVKKLHDEKILVDIKHLGYSGRVALYAERDIKGYDQPIICTHAGIAGVPMSDRLKFLRSKPRMLMTEGRNQQVVKVWQIEHLKPKGHVKPPNSTNPMSAYNLSSINLYDEDILRILMSGGLIGISLDQRIVGYPTDSIGHAADVFPSDVEYIADADAKVFFGPNPVNVPIFNGSVDEVLTGAEAEDHNTLTHDSHARYWINQVIHVLMVAKKNNMLESALKQICIGSDFDGLINAIDCCENAEAFEEFKGQLSRLMKEKKFWQGTGLNEGEVNVDSFLEGLFFENAFKFLEKNFK